MYYLHGRSNLYGKKTLPDSYFIPLKTQEYSFFY